MKSILYVGATLMIGASIYGFVDYKQTQGKKEFKDMYVEEKGTAPVEIADNKTTVPVTQKTITVNEKKAVTKKQAVIKDAEHSGGSIVPIKPIAVDEKLAVKEIKEMGNEPVAVKSPEENAVKKVKKKKKISSKMFSRGSMEDRYIEPKEKVALPKEEVKISEKKEQ